MNGDEGGRVLSFQKKRKNQRKIDWVFLPHGYFLFVLWVAVFFIREAARLVLSLDFFIRYEPAAFTMFVSAFITRFVI